MHQYVTRYSARWLLEHAMTTESGVSDCASGDVSARGASKSLASRVRLRKLTTTKTQQAVKMTTKTSSSSEYFTSDSHKSGKKSDSKRKRAAKTVSNTADTCKSDIPQNCGLSIVDTAKAARVLRGKRQSTETVRKTKRRCQRTKRVSSEAGSIAEDTPVSALLLPSCSTVQNSSVSCDCAAEASDDENTSSSSDVEWEDVEGRSSC